MIEKMINDDLRNAMVSKDVIALEAIRAIKTKIQVEKAKTGIDLDDENTLKVIQKLISERSESATQYAIGNRQDLADHENKLIEIFKKYLPKQLSQDEIDKGIAKRYFVQDNRDKKISETSQELFEQGKEGIPDFTYIEVPWNITNPAEDLIVNGIKFQGSESRNKETIHNLEKDMPGISKFVTDYRYLIPKVTVPTAAEQDKVQTQVIKDPNTGQQDFRKANFDLRK
jgi:uncharacterized protein YqeY